MKHNTMDLAAIVRHARRHNPNWVAAVVRNATAAQRQKLLRAIVDGWGIEGALELLAKAVIELRAARKRARRNAA